MRLQAAMLADAAYVGEGKFFIHGGGFTTITAMGLPVRHPTMSLVLLIEIDWTESETAHSIEARLFNDETQDALVTLGPFPVGGVRPVGTRFEDPILVPFQATLANIEFPNVGSYRWVITRGDERLGEIFFRVQLMQPVGGVAFGQQEHPGG